MELIIVHFRYGHVDKRIIDKTKVKLDYVQSNSSIQDSKDSRNS